MQTSLLSEPCSSATGPMGALTGEQEQEATFFYCQGRCPNGVELACSQSFRLPRQLKMHIAGRCPLCGAYWKAWTKDSTSRQRADAKSSRKLHDASPHKDHPKKRFICADSTAYNHGQAGCENGFWPWSVLRRHWQYGLCTGQLETQSATLQMSTENGVPNLERMIAHDLSQHGVHGTPLSVIEPKFLQAGCPDIDGETQSQTTHEIPESLESPLYDMCNASNPHLASSQLQLHGRQSASSSVYLEPFPTMGGSDQSVFSMDTVSDLDFHKISSLFAQS